MSVFHVVHSHGIIGLCVSKLLALFPGYDVMALQNIYYICKNGCQEEEQMGLIDVWGEPPYQKLLEQMVHNHFLFIKTICTGLLRLEQHG